MRLRGKYISNIKGDRLSLPSVIAKNYQGNSFMAAGHIKRDIRWIVLYDQGKSDYSISAEEDTTCDERPGECPPDQGKEFYLDDVVVSKNGKIILPERVKQFLGLGEKAVIIRNIDFFELWNPQTWARYDERHGGPLEPRLEEVA